MLLKQIRIHQWLKNILIFSPIVLSHQLNNIFLLSKSFNYFFIFSITASFIYIINDMLDLQNDREHPEKKNRPLASGNISIAQGILCLIGITIYILLAAIFYLDLISTLVLFLYMSLSSLYSFRLKEYPLVDVYFLAMLYLIRVIFGVCATNIYPSFWFLSWILFFFLGLAFLKRFSEINRLSAHEIRVSRRKYSKDDMQLLGIVGISFSINATFFLTLYLNTVEIQEKYQLPELIWLILICYIFWIVYVWHCSFRKKMNYDPVIFTFKDRTSIICAIICVLLFIVSY